LGVEEWRIPVGRAETTRKGEGEEERVADDDHDNQARKNERGEEGRERRDQGRCNTQKSGGEGAPIGVGAGRVRGSDERGDRRAEERQKRVQTDGEWESGDRGQRRPRQNRQEGKMCSVGKEAKDLRPARAEWPTACVGWATGGRARDGQPPSPFKKKKEEGTCNSSLIKIIFR
jgi:hypothetical protein